MIPATGDFPPLLILVMVRAMDRADAKTVPIIAMTANAFEEDAKRCLAAGMTAHLAKPFQIEDVEKAIVECCGK